MSSNGTNVAVTGVIDDQQPQAEHKTLFDPTADMFQPPKETPKSKKGYWKRRVFIWLVILVMICCGVGLLYWLVKVNHVNVRVLADNRRNSASAKEESHSEERESGLSADAINIARAAVGNDAVPSPVAPGAGVSPVSSNNERSLAHATTELTLGPATDQRVASAESTPLSSGDSTTNLTTQEKPTAETTVQSRANTAQTILVADDPPPALSRTPVVEATPAKAQLEIQKKAVDPPKKVVVLPPFGTMLPVRTQNVLLSIRNNSYSRLELTRTISGEGWSLPKGTVLIGRTNGSELDRAFINVLGYVDAHENRMVIMKGEVLGSDGGTGLPGKRMTGDRNRFKQTLAKLGASGLQVASTMAGALTGRLPVFINNSADEVFGPTFGRAGLSASRNARSFVKVKAGESGYVMVADLPKEIDSTDASGTEELKTVATSLTDVEVMELILFGTPDEIQGAVPLMNAQQRAMVGRTTSAEGTKP